MEIDVKGEKARIEAEIKGLNSELQELEDKRQELANEIVRRQGMLIFLDKLDGHKEADRRR